MDDSNGYRTRSGRTVRKPTRFQPTMNDDGTPSWDENEAHEFLKELDEMSDVESINSEDTECSLVQPGEHEHVHHDSEMDDFVLDDNKDMMSDGEYELDEEDEELSSEEEDLEYDESSDAQSSYVDSENNDDDELYNEDPMKTESDLENEDADRYPEDSHESSCTESVVDLSLDDHKQTKNDEIVIQTNEPMESIEEQEVQETEERAEQFANDVLNENDDGNLSMPPLVYQETPHNVLENADGTITFEYYNYYK